MILAYSQTSHRQAIAYLPPTNDLTKRLNKTIADMLAMYVDVEHKTWDTVLLYLTFAYTMAVQEMTQMSSFKLDYGMNPEKSCTTHAQTALSHANTIHTYTDISIQATKSKIETKM